MNQPANDDWRAALPEEARNWDEVKNSADMGAFIKQVGDLRSHLGSALRLPGPDASDADKQAFRQKVIEKNLGLMPMPNDEASQLQVLQAMGLPKEAKDYALDETLAKDLEGQNIDTMRGMALKAGLTNKQFNAFMKDFGGMNSAALKGAREALEAGHAQLKGEWGEAYDQRVAAALAVAEKSGAPAELVKNIKERNIDAGVLRWIHSMAAALPEGGNLNAGANGNNSGKLTPAEAKQRIAEVLNNPQHLYHTGDKDAVDYFVSLHNFLPS